MRFFIQIFIISAFLVFCFSGMIDQAYSFQRDEITCQMNKLWQGRYANGKLLTQKELRRRLELHEKWAEDAKSLIKKEWERKRANLGEAKYETWFRDFLDSDWGKDKGRLILEGADLSCVDLRKRNLKFANLKGVNLQNSILTNANFRDAVLRSANLKKAKLDGADLGYAILEDASLMRAELKGVNLFRTDMKNAVVWGANLHNSCYQVKIDRQPGLVGLSETKNLHTMYTDSSSHALAELRQIFRKAGLRQKEREITYAIKRSEWLKMKCSESLEKWLRKMEGCEKRYLEAIFNYILFDIPVAYGLYPGRAIKILFGFVFLFAIPYCFAFIKTRSVKKDGIWRVWPKDRPRQNFGSETPELIVVNGWRVFTFAIYFSLLSAFHIGWRELNVGSWIARLQPHGYILRATGWARTLSGIQSLISVYLLAMWVLTYFGRPFE